MTEVQSCLLGYYDYSITLVTPIERSNLGVIVVITRITPSKAQLRYYLYNPEAQKVEMHWHGFVSDEKKQDSRTSFANAEKFVQYI